MRAYLTIAADGRASLIRERLALPLRTFGAPMDVLWFRLSRRSSDGDGLEMRVGPGRLMLDIDRGDYWQVASVIGKGSADKVQDEGPPRFRDSVAQQALPPADRVGEITGWQDVRTLSVRMDRLRRWYAPGVLLIGDAAHAMSPIGDAAHAMSPIGGVGINLAVQARR